jgi:16S rRNA (adenine1518-N6/adenine1519-N6)-dimethyltransferase
MSRRPDDPPDPRDLLRRYDLHPKRAFSQNFLIQPDVVARIADTVASLGHEVVELGPGLGTLTHALLARDCVVCAVELDRDMVHVLTHEYANEDHLLVIEADAAEFDLRNHAAKRGRKVVVTGNLPYRSTGSILRRVVAQHDALEGAVLMVQKEVRDRLIATPGHKAYGALTVFSRAVFEVETVCRLRPGSFYPPPKVESTVVRLIPRMTPLAEETTAFQSVVRAAFQTRRKTLRNAMRALGDPGRVIDALQAAGIDPDRRGETLSIAEFASLAGAWSESA